MSKKNWDQVLNTCQEKLNDWGSRALSLVGKANIIKAQITPIFMFHASVLVPPDEFYQKFNKCIFSFVGSREARARLHVPRNEGGLGILHARARAEAGRIKWLTRLRNKLERAEWMNVFEYEGVCSDKLNSRILVDLDPNTFIGQCIMSWNGLCTLLESTKEEAPLKECTDVNIKETFGIPESATFQDLRFKTVDMNFL